MDAGGWFEIETLFVAKLLHVAQNCTYYYHNHKNLKRRMIQIYLHHFNIDYFQISVEIV